MTNPPAVQQLDADVYLIPLPVPLTGFDGFITTWVYTGGPVVVVDVGPSSAADHLCATLADIGVSKPDAFLLTHIHLDHAGGIGHVARAFPHTPVVCHPKALPHLIDPQRLWDGSVKTLGDVARRYGPMVPVAARRLIPADELALPAVTAVATPGHAVHQYSYLIDDLLFAGEAGGVCIGLGEGRFYMRPATPPRFFLETYLESIDRLIALKPGRIGYGHIGMQPQAAARLADHSRQLLLWQRLIKPWVDADAQLTPAREDDCLDHLLANDPLLAGFAELSAEAQERERFFLRNSLRGYWGYLVGG